MPVDIHAEVKKAFFDSIKVQKALDKKTRKILTRVGGRIRKFAQFSMKPGGKGGKVAAPGEAPRTHKTKLLKRMLYFAYDFKAKTVVVGPVLLDRTKDLGIPRLMEVGGSQTIQEKTKTVVREYHPHPYMQPAFMSNVSFIAGEFGKGGLI